MQPFMPSTQRLRYPAVSFYVLNLLVNYFANMGRLNPDDLQRIFTELDKNGDGQLSLAELNWLLEKIGVDYSLSELESIVGNQSLDFNQFVFFWNSISRKNRNDGQNGEDIKKDVIEDDEVADMAKAFKVFDVNGDGYISCPELQSVLSRLGLWDENSGMDCKKMICMYDTNLDGVLDFEEFKNMMFQTN